METGEPQPVIVHSVVRGPGSSGTVRITIRGTWRTPGDGGEPQLLVGHESGERRVVRALSTPPEGDAADFHAAFDVPAALGGSALVLAVGGAEMCLPEALPGVPPAPVREVTAEAPPVPAEVIDRAVLAEHRARRAEDARDEVSERLATLEAHLADVTTDRDRLRGEQSEAEEAEERRSGPWESATADPQAALAEARKARDDALQRLTTARAELAGMREELDAAREELAVVREERDGLRDAVARADRIVPDDHAASLAELGETARALRARAEEQLAAQVPHGPAPADPFDVALAGLRARSAPSPDPAEAEERRTHGRRTQGRVIPFDPLRNTMNLAAMSPPRRARSRLRRVAPDDRHVLPASPLEAQRRSGVAWLSDAVARLAGDDILAASAFVLSLLPDAARTFAEDLVFDVELDGLAPHRATLRDRAGSVVERTQDMHDEAAFSVSGPVTAVAPLAAGGAPRRLGGVRVTGSRRALRRLVKARREPVDLGDLAAGGVVPEPGLLLRVLAAAVRPAWTGTNDFAVAIDVPERDPITVVAAPGRRLQVTGAPPDGGAVRAVVTASPAALLALLGRVAPPDGDDAWVTGEEDAVRTLLDLLDRAQGLPSRG